MRLNQLAKGGNNYPVPGIHELVLRLGVAVGRLSQIFRWRAC